MTLQVGDLLLGIVVVAFIAGCVVAVRRSARPSPPEPLPSEPDWHSPLRVDATIVQGNNGSFSHQERHSRYAWDYGVPEGSPVVAARSGVVTRSDFHSNIGGDTRAYADDGNCIRIHHSDGLVSVYLHLAKDGDPPRVGEYVHQGEVIGLSGDTGFSRGPHLHFVVLRDGKSVPIRFADYRSGAGVPVKGDTHLAADPARIPDHVLSWAKDRYRAASNAARHGWPEIGLQLVHDLQPARAHGDHHTLLSLEHLRAALVRRAMRDVRRLTRKRRPNLRVALRAYSMERALRRLDDAAELAGPLCSFREALPSRMHDELRLSIAPLRAFVRGMRSQCRDDKVGAMELYADAITRATAPVQLHVKPIARHMARRYVTQLRRQMARQTHEAARCDNRHRVAVVRDTERLVASGEAFLKHASGVLPPDLGLGADLERHRTAILQRLL